jgi:hypothetical protein
MKSVSTNIMQLMWKSIINIELMFKLLFKYFQRKGKKTHKVISCHKIIKMSFIIFIISVHKHLLCIIMKMSRICGQQYLIINYTECK